MSSPREKPGREVMDEAAAWVIREDRGLSADEQDRLSQWLAADSSHREAWARQRGHWRRLEPLARWLPEHSAEPNPDLLAPPRRSRAWWRPALAAAARYVVPELQLDDTWKQAQLIACPGCYPTSIQVPLVPLLRAGLVKPEPGRLIINSYSGVSGAGKKADVGYLFCERDSSIKAYGIPGHRHIAEIEEQFGVAAGQPVVVQFNPHLAPMHRGIATTIVVPAAGVTAAQVEAVWQQAYAGRPFVSVLKSGDFPDTAHVANTNRVAMSVVADARTGNLIITSVIDNLLKGAGGQAVQALNLLMGWSETAGLR